MRKVVRTPDFPIVDTPSGKLHGFLDNDVYHFYGIRYAIAGRFEMPRPVPAWKGVKDAKAYGYICPLLPEDPHAEGDPNGAPENSFEMPHVYWPMSENCQYLNVWTRHINEPANRPVLVWLHGGGYCAGSSIEIPAYNGHNLAASSDVVVVNLNHRLNVLGFLDLSSFGEKYASTGILGMEDIVTALRWVRENIAAFGGDPDNVTVAGQSGGGGKVAALLQMPEADGLYSKVIIESGALGNGKGREMTEGEAKTADPDDSIHSEGFLEEKKKWQRLGEKTVEMLNLNKDSIDEIKTVSYDLLADAATEAAKSLHMLTGMMMLEPSPVAGKYIGRYFEAGFRKETRNIPMIIGTTLGEFTFMHYLGDKNSYSEEEKMDILRQNLGGKADEIVKEFHRIYPDKDILYAMSADTKFKRPAYRMACSRAAWTDAPVYCYQMNLIVPYMGGLALWHCGEIPFVFRNAEMEPVQCTGDYLEDMQDLVSGAWTAFMQSGNPSTDRFAWKPFTTREHHLAFLDEKPEMVLEDDEKLVNLLASVRPPFLA